VSWEISEKGVSRQLRFLNPKVSLNSIAIGKGLAGSGSIKKSGVFMAHPTNAATLCQ
jgi:hypothetical protein